MAGLKIFTYNPDTYRDIMSGFLNIKGLKTRSLDGRNCILLEYLYYRTEDGRMLRTRTATDGISTPAFLWIIIPPFGRIWWSGIIHDGCYRDSIEIWDTEAGWIPWHPSQKQADSLIFEAMKSQNARYVMRFIIYMNLRWFGWRAYDEDHGLYSKRLAAKVHCERHLRENPCEEKKHKTSRSGVISGTATYDAAIPGLPSPKPVRALRRA